MIAIMIFGGLSTILALVLGTWLLSDEDGRWGGIGLMLVGCIIIIVMCLGIHDIAINEMTEKMLTKGTKITYGGVEGIIKTDIKDGKFAIEVKGQVYVVSPSDVQVIK